MSQSYLNRAAHSIRRTRSLPGDPEESWVDKPDIYAKATGRGTDMSISEDEVFPTRRDPASMDFDAPLHTPYGTAERTDVDFWGGERNLLMERRSLLPSFVVAEHEWDRNPRECGLRASYVTPDPYESAGSVSWSQGANLARSVDVRELSNNRYASFTQKTNPTAYGADPIIGGGQGGMGPVLMPFLGKKGTPKGPVPDYVSPAGGALPSAGNLAAEYQLPSATRSLRTHEESGGVTGGFVADFGNEAVNPYEGARVRNLLEYEEEGWVNGGYIASGADTTINDPNKGARWRQVLTRPGGDDNIFNGSQLTTGPSLDATPYEGGRERILTDSLLDTRGNSGAATGIGSSLEQNPQDGGRGRVIIQWDTIGLGGASAGIGSSLEQNPQDGGRNRMLLESTLDTRGNPGALFGMGSSLTENPQDGGRVSRLLNFDTIGLGGALAGVGSSLTENPQDGGRVSKLLNFDTVIAGGALSGVSGIENNDILGGNRWTRTDGVVGRVPSGGFKNGYYGGEIAYGKEIGPREHRQEVTSIMIPGASGRGTPVAPEVFVSLPTTISNAGGVWDDSPDPVLQQAARSTIGSRFLLNFTRANMDELAVDRPC